MLKDWGITLSPNKCFWWQNPVFQVPSNVHITRSLKKGPVYSSLVSSVLHYFAESGRSLQNADNEVRWLRWQSSSFLLGRPGFKSCRFWFHFWSISKCDHMAQMAEQRLLTWRTQVLIHALGPMRSSFIITRIDGYIVTIWNVTPLLLGGSNFYFSHFSPM